MLSHKEQLAVFINDACGGQSEFEKFPAVIQKLMTDYPYPTYKVKEGAPYGISCPGSIVHVCNWNNDGSLSVIVYAKDKLPSAIEHEKSLCEQHKTDYEKVKGKDTLCNVNPSWLEPYEEQK